MVIIQNAEFWRRLYIQLNVKLNRWVNSYWQYLGYSPKSAHYFIYARQDVVKAVHCHCCLHDDSRIWKETSLGNTQVSHKISGPRGFSLYTNQCGFGWLCHLLHMPPERIPRCTLLSQADDGQEMGRSGQLVTWQKVRRL